MGKREVVKTKLKRGAKVFAKILTSGPQGSGRVLQEETLRLLQVKLGDEFILVDEPDGRVSLVGTVEVGRVQDPGQLLVRSESSLGAGGNSLVHCSTTGPVVCEWCGSCWNEDADPEEGGDVSVGIIDFNGLQIVAECCGKLFDILFDELGSDFFDKFLAMVVANPWSPTLQLQTRRVLKATSDIRDKAHELKKETNEALDGIKFVPKTRPF